MICANCSHYNRDGLDFCTNCGQGLESNKCANGHTIPAGVSECPYCPSTGHKKTVQEVGLPGVPGASAAPSGGGPRKTVLVGESEIQQQLSNSPAPQRAGASGGARGSKTVYRPAGEDGALFAAMDRGPGSERGPAEPEGPRGVEEVDGFEGPEPLHQDD